MWDREELTQPCSLRKDIWQCIWKKDNCSTAVYMQSILHQNHPFAETFPEGNISLVFKNLHIFHVNLDCICIFFWSWRPSPFSEPCCLLRATPAALGWGLGRGWQLTYQPTSAHQPCWLVQVLQPKQKERRRVLVAQEQDLKPLGTCTFTKLLAECLVSTLFVLC